MSAVDTTIAEEAHTAKENLAMPQPGPRTPVTPAYSMTTEAAI